MLVSILLVNPAYLLVRFSFGSYPLTPLSTVALELKPIATPPETLALASLPITTTASIFFVALLPVTFAFGPNITELLVKILLLPALFPILILLFPVKTRPASLPIATLVLPSDCKPAPKPIPIL